MTDRREENQSEIAARLIRHGKELLRAKRRVTEFSRNAESDKLLNDLDGYPHAFVIACLVDRQMTAEKAWLVPYLLSQRLGGFSFEHLQLLTERQIAHAFRKPTPLHRFPDVMSKCVFLAIRRISDWAVADLPDPDSPTSAIVRPGVSSKLTPSTTVAPSRSLPKRVVRFSTTRRGADVFVIDGSSVDQGHRGCRLR